MTYFIGNNIFEYENIASCDLSFCVDYLKNKEVVALDIETSRLYKKGTYPEDIYKPALDPYLSRVIMLQIGDLENRFVIDTRYVDISPLKEIIESKLIIGHNCLPRETDVLTTKGWKPIDTITESDIVYGDNNGVIKPQKVNATIKTRDVIWNASNFHKTFRSTKGHRWLSTNRNGKDLKYRTTEEIVGTRNRIILNTSYKKSDGVNLTDDELQLFTWAITDGKIFFNKGGTPGCISITQSRKKIHNVEEIKHIINRLGFKVKEYLIPFEGYEPCYRFVTNVKDARSIFNKINLHSKEFCFVNFVLRLNNHQIKIFIDTFIKAEGHITKNGDISIAQSHTVNKNKRDAIALACFLDGKLVSDDGSLNLRVLKRNFSTGRTLHVIEEPEQKVYCLNVPFSNFVARQNGDIFLTGNCLFEYKHLKHSFNIRLKKVWDTMLAELCLTNGLNLGYSLADLAGRYLGVKQVEDVTLFSLDQFNKEIEGLKKEGIADEELTAEYTQRHWASTYIDKSTRMGFINIEDRPFTQAQVEYGADDIELPLLIREEQLKGYKYKEEVYFPEKHIYLENEFVLVLGDIELNGMHFDPKVWMDIYNKQSLPNLLKANEWLNNWVVNNTPKFTSSGDLFSGYGTCAIEWSSSKQVVSLFRYLGFCPKERSKSTGRIDWTVGDIALQKVLLKKEWAAYFELIRTYLKYKEWEQACTTFGKDFLKYIHPITKRIHSSYRQILHTYRISSRNPNLQNIPGDDHRKAFTAPKDWTLINADFSGQETVVLACLSDNQALCDLLNSGADPHCFIATKMFRVKLNDPDLEVTLESAGKGPLGKSDPKFNPEHARMRQAAKAIGFGIPYGKSAHSLQWDLNTDVDTAQEFIDMYYDTFPGLKEHFESRHKGAMSGYITIDPLTKNRYFFEPFDQMLKYKEEVYKILPDNYNTLNKEQKEQIKLQYKSRTSPLWKKFFYLLGKLQRRSQNYEIQGTAGSITKTAAILIRKEIYEKNLQDWIKLTNLVHDETNTEALKRYADEAREMVRRNMIRAGAFWCKTSKLNAEANIVNYWSHS